MILVTAKVGENTPDEEMSILKEEIFEKLNEAAVRRNDLQIIEILVCASSVVTKKDIKVDMFMSLEEKDDRVFCYRKVIFDSIRKAGFNLFNIDTFNVNEYVCKIFYKKD